MVSRRLSSIERWRMGGRVRPSPLRVTLPLGPQRNLTEEEAELADYERNGGDGGEPYEKEVVFGMLGAGSLLMILVLGWVIFKKLWFGWLAMPGWW